MSTRSRTWRLRVVVTTAFSLPLVMLASMLGGVPPALADMPSDSGPPPGEKPAVRAPMPPRLQPSNRVGAAAVTGSQKVTWPGRAVADIDLASGLRGALASATGDRVKADGMPVSVGPAERATFAQASAFVVPQTPQRIQVEMLGHDAALAAGLDGLLLKVSRTDGIAAKGEVSVNVDYSGFRQAYGGDWAGRLRLVRLPACAQSSPQLAQCQGEELPFVNDTVAGKIRADVGLDAARSSAQKSASEVSLATGTMIGLTAGSGGEGGAYSATGLSPAAAWQSGGSTGDFSWGYTLPVPPSLGGPSPQVGLAYSSGNVDGRVSSVNTQPAWTGEGFDYWPGFVERKYKDCQADGWLAYDNCWFTDNATISLNGKASELVKDDTTGVWRLKRDDGSKVERLTGANNGDLNRDGTTEGEYWKVTTSDGTQYFFGLHKLSSVPANAGVTGMPGTPDSNSTWTMPVVGNNTGEPCFLTHPSNSVCDQAWRWNLDYVVDTHGNTMAYFYVKESNKYRSVTLGADRTYTRNGYVDRIEYGLRAAQTWTTTAAPARVKFTAVERCTPGSACVKPGDYLDVPWDQECTGTCTKVSPTFWTTKRLSKITTQVIRAGAYDDVDSWTLTHSFPATGDAIGTPVLWLNQIQHTGHLGTVDESMPPTVFDGAPMDNRITASGNQVRKWRMTHINNESGGSVVITYKPNECSTANLPASPQANTKRCMPVWWAPPGGGEGLYWFHKYVIASVNEQDLNGIGASTTEEYEYLGNAAWHYDEDSGLVPPERKTWGQWRGYGLVEKRAGTAADGKTLQATRYYRGMNGDRNDPSNPASKRPASETNITDGLGGVVADLDELTGQPREQINYAADGGTVLTRSVTDGWVSTTTAQAVFPWATVKAAFSDVNTTRVQSKTVNSTRINRVTKTINSSNGQVTMMSDLGDELVPGDEECSRITYAPNTTFAIRTEKYALNCSAVPLLNADGTLVTEVASEEDIISDDRTLYDGATAWSPNMVVAKGDVTEVQQLKSWSPTQRQYAVITKLEHDVYGRGTKQYDMAGKLTQTIYTPATGGPVTESKTINALGHETRIQVDAGNGQPLVQIDPNGRRTEMEYDGLGRIVRSWLPGRVKGIDPPNSHVDYKVRTNGVNYVTTRSIRPDGSYNVSIEIYDGLMRPVQTQISAPGGGRTVASTFYNSRGQVVKQHAAFYDPASPTAAYQPFTDASIPAQMRTIYDGTGRATAEVYDKYGVEQYRSQATFEGDRITSTPPAGGMPTQVVFDSLGRAKELKEFKTTSTSGAYTSTQYKFNKRSQQSEVWDSANNKWTYKYDIRGRLIESTDPDKGKSRTVYNDSNDVVYTENNIDPVTGVGQKIYMEYDDLGRVIRTRKDSAAGTILTEGVYDTLVKGAPTSTTRYVNGEAYTTAIAGYDDAYRPMGHSITLPSAEGVLAGTYSFGATYNPDGTPATTTSPLMFDLPAETFTHGYTPEGLPLSTSSHLGTYVNTAFYSPYGELTKLVLGVSPKRVNLNFSYQEGSRRIDSTWVTRDGLLGNVHKDVYSYNNIGDLTKIVTTGSGQTADTQCFGYDEKRRLTKAFTPSSGDCASTPTSGTLGGPSPYWHDWKYDSTGASGEVTVGNRTEQVKHAIVAGGVDAKTEYFYPVAGANKPHTLDQTKVTDAAGIRWYDYDYDHSGRTIKRPSASGAVQDLTWNPDGTLQKVVEGGTTTSYIYDAAGNRLLQKDSSGGVTAFIGDAQIKLVGTVATATRYYSFGGQTFAMRTAAGLKWLANNHQGTSMVAISAANTATVERRRFTPFGEDRAGSSAWTGNRGFVDGVSDPTGLTHLGAREYDPVTGRFLSTDPIMNSGDPQQMHGYSYANNNPVTYSDRSGLMHVADGGGGGGSGGDTTTTGDGTGVDDGEITLPPDIQAMLDEANRIKKMSLLDVILEAGGEILKELLGINDILNCFQKGDIVACISIVANIIPWAKIFKLPKIVKAIERAWSAVNAFWEKLKWAKRVFAQVEEYYQLARKAAAEAAEKLAAARKAKAEAEAAAKAAKAKAEAEAKKAAKEAVEARAKKEAKDAADCHSFAAGTLVLLADGSTKPIEKVRTGDKVQATDPETGETTEREVTTRYINQDEDLTEVTVVDEQGKTSQIETTWHHPFWDKTIANWVDARDLAVGHELLVYDAAKAGRKVKVAAVANTVGLQQMYDLTVSWVHTYYVLAEQDPVLVHNCKKRIDGDLPQKGQTAVYALIDQHGIVLKYGKAGQKSLFKRYTCARLEHLGARMQIIDNYDSARDALKAERYMTSRFGGELNFEKWSETIVPELSFHDSLNFMKRGGGLFREW